MIYQLSPLTEKKKRRDATIMHIAVAVILCAVGLLSTGVYLFMQYYQEKEKTVFTYAQKLPFLVTAVAATASGLAILLIGIFRKVWLRRQRNSATLHGIEILMMAVLAAGFAVYNLYIPTALFAVTALLVGASVLWERRHHRGPADIALSAQGIRLTGGGQRLRELPWWEVEKVLLRHGILTVEATGNRLFQRHVEPVHFNVADFEAWCATHIDAQAEKRRKADW